MKKISIITSLLLFLFVSLNAQTVPLGMKYQAIARDHSGDILANKNIHLKITLYSQKDSQIQYSEIHTSKTNEHGLFSLTVGEGEKRDGRFENIPWGTENIWMKLAIDEKGDQSFFTIHDSKLLTVPYAFHAATASQLVGAAATSDSRKDAAYWNVGGNEFSLFEPDGAETHTFGTLNTHDLILITNNTPAMNISGVNGKVEIIGDAEVGNNLKVDNDANVNRNLSVNNNLKVDNATTTDFLDVRKGVSLNTAGAAGENTVIYGPTRIKNQLQVNLATDLKSTLNVDGVTDLNSDLFVNNESPSKLTGTLNVDGITDLNNNLNVNNESPSTLTGTLDVEGITSIKNTTESTHPSNGALHVFGGIGIEKKLNVAGETKIDNTLRVVTNGNAGELNSNVASFENTANGNGIQIKVGTAIPHNNNNFITFLNGNGVAVGRIEGENGAADLANNPWYQDALDGSDIDIALATSGVTIAEKDLSIASNEKLVAIADVAIAAADLVVATSAVFAASTSSSACGGVGACVTAPIPSFIASSGVALGIAIANQASVVANLVLVSQNKTSAEENLTLAKNDKQAIVDNKQGYIDLYEETIGVTYASGAGDYAEYLQKLNLEDDFIPGDVVGMKNGLISKNTLNADRVMVISFKPAVLGALPEAGTEHNYEKVAFLGQIPTKVYGKVNKGDYILPSGFHNLCAIAKHPSKMLLSDYKKILGVAWEDSNTTGINYVNVAVGLNVNDFSEVIQQQATELKELRNQITHNNDQLKETKNILADLVPGFREAANLNSPNQGPAFASLDEIESHDHAHDHSHDHTSKKNFLTQHDVEMVQPDLSNIVYYVPEKSEYENWLKMARQAFIDQGIDVVNHPFFHRLDTDPDYLEEVVLEMEKRFEARIHYHVEIDEDK